jgi:septal ring-binding cell division protein DamX
MKGLLSNQPGHLHRKRVSDRQDGSCRPLATRPSPSARESARHNLETRFNSREKLAKKAAVISGTGAADDLRRATKDIVLNQGMPIMKKTLLSALGLAVALAFAVPALGTTEANAAATTAATATAPAATTEAAKPAATEAAKPASNGPHKKHHRKHHRHHARKHHHVKKHAKHHAKKHHVKKHHVRKHHVKKHVAKKAA